MMKSSGDVVMTSSGDVAINPYSPMHQSASRVSCGSNVYVVRAVCVCVCVRVCVCVCVCERGGSALEIAYSNRVMQSSDRSDLK